jgi:hypothetical protein
MDGRKYVDYFLVLRFVDYLLIYYDIDEDKTDLFLNSS